MRRITILLIICLAFAAQAFGQDTVKLEYKYIPGEALRYKMVFDAKLELNAANGQSFSIPVRMAGVFKQKTRRVLANGNAEIVIAFESMRAQIGDEVRNLPVKELPVMTLVTSKSGQVQSISSKGMKSVGFMNSQMLGSGGFGHYVVLPTTDLRVGDTWTQAVPDIPGLANVSGRGKLISANTKVGKYKTAAFTQSVGGNLNLDSALALPIQGNSPIPPGMKMDGAFLGDSTIYFSVERGQLIRTDGRIDLQVNVNVPQIAGHAVGSASAMMEMTYEMYLLSSGK